MKAGDMVNLPLNAATRDEAAFADATTVDISRKPNNHIAFGAGPHRCLGSHLARRELRIAMEGRHERIPHYRLDPDVALHETGGRSASKPGRCARMSSRSDLRIGLPTVSTTTAVETEAGNRCSPSRFARPNCGRGL
ncbi:MAG: hypothetical protein QOD39_5602 [Mycobacterium sp.]|jgi:cytochrome P450|nr:hypothetical protein [Mycobacterium sp.]